MKSQLQFIPAIFAISALVSIYQVPLIQNTLMNHQVMVDLNASFPYAQNLQQNVEDSKISLSSLFDKKEPKKVVVASVPSSVVASVDVNGVTNNPSSSGVDSNTLIDKTSATDSTPDNTNNTSAPVSKACEKNCTVLMIGDSIMGDVDYSMERMIKKSHPTWQVIDGHKVSSGLTNQSYYNWPKTAQKLLEKNTPDYTVVFMGTNDAQGMMVNGHAFALAKPSWNDEYANRVNQIISLMNKNSAHWFWIELPVMKDKGFNERLQSIRSIQKAATAEHYVSTESIFGSINHTDAFDTKLRAPDGIHFSVSGANDVAKLVDDKIENLLTQ